jgi:hypothetical protein
VEPTENVAGGRAIDLVIDSVGATRPEALWILQSGRPTGQLGGIGSDLASVHVRHYFGQYSILGHRELVAGHGALNRLLKSTVSLLKQCERWFTPYPLRILVSLLPESVNHGSLLW